MQLRERYGAIFGIVLNYFVIYEHYFAIGEFSRTIRAASVYFVVYALFSCLCLV
jgi:hypothetical protein